MEMTHLARKNTRQSCREDYIHDFNFSRERMNEQFAGSWRSVESRKDAQLIFKNYGNRLEPLLRSS